jgi:protein-tyrosine sulfotransferase
MVFNKIMSKFCDSMSKKRMSVTKDFSTNFLVNIEPCSHKTISNVLSPIFIIGVPRSGTTLLRVLLDSHSKIAAASETPWILGVYGDDSVRQLAAFLIESSHGPVKCVPGVSPQSILKAMRAFIDEVFQPYLLIKNKELLVLKTPHDIMHLDFLLKLYHDSKYIHIIRDGRDSACSLVENSSSIFGNEIDGFGKLNHLNAMRRWYEWEIKIRSAFKENEIKPVSLRYEELVGNPVEVLKAVCSGIGVEFEPEMLAYQKHEHELPDWEAGSYDLKKRKKDIDTKSIGRWRERFSKYEIKKVDDLYGTFLKDIGYSN